MESPSLWVDRNDNPPDDHDGGVAAMGESLTPWFPVLDDVIPCLFLWPQKPPLPLVLQQLFPSWTTRVSAWILCSRERQSPAPQYIPSVSSLL